MRYCHRLSYSLPKQLCLSTNNITCWLSRPYCNDDVPSRNAWLYFTHKTLCLRNFLNLFFETVSSNDLIIKTINCHVIFRTTGSDRGGDESDQCRYGGCWEKSGGTWKMLWTVCTAMETVKIVSFDMINEILFPCNVNK